MSFLCDSYRLSLICFLGLQERKKKATEFLAGKTVFASVLYFCFPVILDFTTWGTSPCRFKVLIVLDSFCLNGVSPHFILFRC